MVGFAGGWLCLTQAALLDHLLGISIGNFSKVRFRRICNALNMFEVLCNRWNLRKYN